MHVWRTERRRGVSRGVSTGRRALPRRSLARFVVPALALALATVVAAQGGEVPAAGSSLLSSPYLAAALATGLAAIGAGIAVGIAGAAAIGAISEKPELLGRTLIFVGLAEGIVIYGLIVSFIILGAA